MSMSMSMSLENQTSSPFFFYKITCREKDNKACYIGKTKNYAIRYSTHKSYSKHSNIKLYQYIREHGGFENFKIEIIHKCICDEKSSIFLELHFINDYRNKGFEMLNIQVPNTYPKQEYNIMKCQEHYAVNTDCECGWVGSKMNYCKHLKNSIKHKKYLFKKIEEQIDKNLCDLSPIMSILDGLNEPEFVTL